MNRRSVICPDCGGEGTVWVEVTGGRFDMREEQWFPDEKLEVCDRCHGQGELWFEQLSKWEQSDLLAEEAGDE